MIIDFVVSWSVLSGDVREHIDTHTLHYPLLSHLPVCVSVSPPCPMRWAMGHQPERYTTMRRPVCLTALSRGPHLASNPYLGSLVHLWHWARFPTSQPAGADERSQSQLQLSAGPIQGVSSSPRIAVVVAVVVVVGICSLFWTPWLTLLLCPAGVTFGRSLRRRRVTSSRGRSCSCGPYQRRVSCTTA